MLLRVRVLEHVLHVQSGAWDDVSGETFLRKLLAMPIEHAKWTTVSILAVFPMAVFASDVQYRHCVKLACELDIKECV